MARWRLTTSHYINVPGTEWEYRETDRNTGKQARKVFEVPALLNPSDPNDCNYPGEVIVCRGKGEPKDIVFLGDPTPEMEPLDDEAQAISDSLRAKWEHPIEALPAVGLSAGEQAFIDAFAKIAQGGSASLKGVDDTRLDDLQKQVAELAKQNAELLARLVEPEPKTARRAGRA